MSELATIIRKMFKEGDDVRDAGLTTPNDIERFDNIIYGENEKWQSLDVYRPRAISGKLPVIISVHGGAWVYGDKERYQYYCMNLAQRGFAVVNFSYRLAPEFKYPAPLEDTNLVAKFVMENADIYGFDTSRLFAVGDSAGAHLLGLYSCIMTNPDYASRFTFTVPSDFNFKAIALNCGVYKIDSSDTEGQDMKLMAEFLPNGATADELDEITIANFVTDNYFPTFIMTADGDFLKEQPIHMIAKLLEHNIPHIFRYYTIPETQLGHVFHLNIRLEEAKKCNDEECNFFKTFC